MHVYDIYVYVQIYIYCMWTYGVGLSEGCRCNVAPGKRAVVDILKSQIHICKMYIYICIVSDTHILYMDVWRGAE